MEKRLLNYLSYLEKLVNECRAPARPETADEDTAARERLRQDILTQIAFFQHERLIHLIVTVTFAILTVLSLYGGFLADSPGVYLLTLLLLVLLIPYIRHYYILENGVQRMYRYYDRLFDAWEK